MKKSDQDPTLATLRSLPRERASEGFTQRLLLRLPESSGRSAASEAQPISATWKLRIAAGLLIIFGVVVVIAVTTPRPSESPFGPSAERAAVIEELRSERQRLAAELSELRAATEAARPLALVGVDESHLLVLDLESIADEQSGPTFEILPATYQH